MKDFLTINEAGKVTGLGQAYIRKGCRDGTIPHIKCGRKYLVNYALFLDHLNRESERRCSNGEHE